MPKAYFASNYKPYHQQHQFRIITYEDDDVVDLLFDLFDDLFHVFKIPQVAQKARDFFAIVQSIFVDTPPTF
jgi:hypothetical protein